ncbi:MAG TPA: cytochrome ubiquinol oxidase subunit I [Syntrophales bacterium]|jgi:cytochrome d ubiquinol oxidase subunit I|nr:cytochrome ubiquinol oxidase subunit I [Syntrophales bacterium]HON22726.1 cytochrome ubiquinol oxidase subunit I [Syntrophales bacterium]HOU77762.1 cytochrome ubiquinol oxidase subunit I [Syntrophales bacterium]HQG34911.1 cytochrome ubiquinol oxidase subunit I [Syntrophales bacterium]HQI35901.1 cytochrome ubiquinol oxidase subunit I [Syntrophales bacterium]
MDVLALSRIQFAVTAMFHFLFVPLTLGLSILVAYMESRYVATRDGMYLRMTKFWGRLFLINFALGVATGLSLQFQLGMNWGEYSRYVGDIFAVPLAIEALLAFFLEATFIGLWIFGWKRVSPRLHALSIWIVALATNMSALWILLANGWMQHPVGYVLRNNRAELTDFLALITSGYGWLKFFHTILAGYVVAAFFVMAISAWHLLRKNHLPLFKESFRIGATFGLVSALLVVLVGDFHGAEVGKAQPAKLAAMESLWETQRAVPFYLILVPDPQKERNALELLGIPKMVSFLAFKDGNAEVKGLKDFPRDERPPVWATYVGFRLMVGLGGLFILLSALAAFLSWKDLLERYPLFLKVLLLALPLPYLAGELGWIVAEVGRQPWIVYGVLKTSAAASRGVSALQAVVSLAGFMILYGFLGAVNFYLLAKYARKGPEA